MKFEVIQELPTSGPAPRPFAPSGFPHDPNGLVVKFTGDGDRSLLASFRRGGGEYDSVLRHPNDLEAIVIAGGWAYRINPASPDKTWLFRGGVIGAYEAIARRLVVLMHGSRSQLEISFEALHANGVRWTSGSCRCLDFKDITVDSHLVKGMLQKDLDADWTPFDIHLDTGRARGAQFFKRCGAPEEASGTSTAGSPAREADEITVMVDEVTAAPDRRLRGSRTTQDRRLRGAS